MSPKKNDADEFQEEFSSFDEELDSLFATIKNPSNLAKIEIDAINAAREEIRDAPQMSDERVAGLLEIIQASVDRLNSQIYANEIKVDPGWVTYAESVNERLAEMAKIIEPSN